MWQAWHVWHWAGSGGALGPEWPGWSPRTCSHTTCQHLLTHNLSTHNLSTLTHTQLVHTDLAHNLSTFTWQAWYLVTSTFTLRGRRGTYGIRLFPVARLGRSGRGGRRGCWRGRRGPLRHPPSFHVAGVVLGDIDLHFVWQPWHVCHTRLSSLIFESCSTNCVAQ